jgi:hypothetical protein
MQQATAAGGTIGSALADGSVSPTSSIALRPGYEMLHIFEQRRLERFHRYVVY